MRSVFGLVLVAGLGLAGTAVWLVRGHLEDQSRALAQTRAVAAAATPTVEVLAVTRQLVFGEPLTPADVAPIQYAEPHLPEGVFRTMEELFPEGPDEARIVLRQMEPNEPVLAVKVTAPGEDAGITSRLAHGMRAFAISVDVASGVSGFLRPGDRVDVYWTGSVVEPTGGSREVTRLIEQGLRLVAIDQTSQTDAVAMIVPRTVTVEATPRQVAKLAQAQATGSLALALVGQADQTVAEGIEIDQAALLGIEALPAPAVEVAPPPEVCVRRERRGTEVIEIPTPCPTN
jgi:pilus assembly protein CpaB